MLDGASAICAVPDMDAARTIKMYLWYWGAFLSIFPDTQLSRYNVPVLSVIFNVHGCCKLKRR